MSFLPWSSEITFPMMSNSEAVSWLQCLFLSLKIQLVLKPQNQSKLRYYFGILLFLLLTWQTVHWSFISIIMCVQNPFGNIAPKNPNWDLKRDVQKRIDKLDKRTQKALSEIACECFNMINWLMIPWYSLELVLLVAYVCLDGNFLMFILDHSGAVEQQREKEALEEVQDWPYSWKT